MSRALEAQRAQPETLTTAAQRHANPERDALRRALAEAERRGPTWYVHRHPGGPWALSPFRHVTPPAARRTIRP
jgi:hypothetical protein